jgi:hypothetical protein
MLALQRVIGAAPGFALAVTGLPPGPADAQNTFTALPEGKSEDDKFVYGVYLDGQMIGCADVVRGYPDPSTAFIGLLLISEDSQRLTRPARSHRLCAVRSQAQHSMR